MMSTKLPSVLQRPAGNSISMERALKQVLDLLDYIPVDLYAESKSLEDKVNASIDDLETMLACIDRSGD